ncbi:hypothetical protein GC174_14755 [bacterium]|nr:hypothetical protein [bacterium]
MSAALGKVNILGATVAFSNGVKQTREAISDFNAVKKHILTYNSEADQKFEAENPPPPANGADIRQIAYYGTRTVLLTVELIQSAGEFAQKRLNEQNT